MYLITYNSGKEKKIAMTAQDAANYVQQQGLAADAVNAESDLEAFSKWQSADQLTTIEKMKDPLTGINWIPNNS